MKLSSLKIFFLFLIICFIPNNIYSFKEWWEDSNTLTLTNENFDDIVGKNKYVIVEFFTTWCKYCREMFPEYEKLVNYYNNNNSKTKRDDIIIGRVDANKADVIAIKYGIYQFPLIVMFYPKNKKILNVFQGKRTFDLMKMWIEQRCPKININDNNVENKEKENKKNINEEEELKIKNNNNNNNSELTEESEYVKMEFIDIKKRIKSLENNLNYINDILNNNLENNNNFTNNKNNKINNTKIIIEFDLNYFNIICLIIVLLIIYAIYNSISKILLNNKNK